MLEHVAAHGKAGTARLEGIVHHFEEFAGGLGAGAAGDDHRHAAAGDDVGEGIDVSGVRNFHDVGAELHAHAGTMGNDGGIVFIGDAGAAGVQHGEERHTPFFGHTGDFTEVGEHIALVVVTEVHMHGNAVGTTADGFLNGAYEKDG